MSQSKRGGIEIGNTALADVRSDRLRLDGLRPYRALGCVRQIDDGAGGADCTDHCSNSYAGRAHRGLWGIADGVRCGLTGPAFGAHGSAAVRSPDGTGCDSGAANNDSDGQSHV